ncbi:hypothetical protein PCE1_002069 [Barthelona sp. PCE]
MEKEASFEYEEHDEGWFDDIEEHMEEDEVCASEEEYEPVEVEQKCEYCSCNDACSLVYCEICEKWFCNSKEGLSSASHIVHHMVRSHHNNVSLHPANPLGETQLECFNCRCRNIFLLGFIPAKEDNVMALVCRDRCLHRAVHKDLSWDTSNWQPLIENKGFVEWLVQAPYKTQTKEYRRITRQDALMLENLWHTDASKTYEDLKAPELSLVEECDPILLRYDTIDQYTEVFEKLIDKEAENQRKLKESQQFPNIEVTFENDGTQILAKFQLPMFETDLRIIPGDSILITLPQNVISEQKFTKKKQKNFTSTQGFVLQRSSSEEIIASITNHSFKMNLSAVFTVKFVWKSISFDRMKMALRRFQKPRSCSPIIKKYLLGQDDKITRLRFTLPQDLSAPGLPPLDHSQAQAIRQVLQQPLALIQGPPGTGKTVTSATIIYHLVQKKQTPVLVCAPSNIAADQLAQQIHKTGVRVVRFCAVSRENIPSSIEFLCLHKLIQYCDHEENPRLHALIQKQQEDGFLTISDERVLRKVKTKVEINMLHAADVIVCTCVCAGDSRLSKFRFKTVLIDESTQATEPEVLIPITKGAQQVILIGDHCQLGPVVMDKSASKAGFVQSLFERLVLLSYWPYRLEVQYRMHPRLSEFPSRVFYEGTLQNGVSFEDRTNQLTWNWPVADCPMVFHVSTGIEELSASGTSYINRTEADIVLKAITSFIQSGTHPSEVGVITPYEGQRAYLTNLLNRQSIVTTDIIRDLEVASVDSFQGREKKYIIMSCVRSNPLRIIGFLRESRRLNVALTRAQYGIILVGNPQVLASNPLWNLLLHHFKKHGCLVEGQFGNWRTSQIHLPSTSKIHSNRSPFDGALAAQLTSHLTNAPMPLSNEYPYFTFNKRRVKMQMNLINQPKPANIAVEEYQEREPEPEEFIMESDKESQEEPVVEQRQDAATTTPAIPAQFMSNPYTFNTMNPMFNFPFPNAAIPDLNWNGMFQSMGHFQTNPFAQPQNT